MTADRPADPFPPLEEAVQRLVDDLNKINPLNPVGAPDNDDPDNDDPAFYDPAFYERARIIATLVPITEFMMSLPEPADKAWVRPLFTLLGHLWDVQKGVKSQLFSRDRKRGPPKPPTVERFTRAHAAAVMQLFTVDGCSNEEAARRVARRLIHNGNSHLFTNRSPPHEQVERWRENVTGDVSAEAGQYYQSLIAMVKATRLGPEQAAKNLLELLP